MQASLKILSVLVFQYQPLGMYLIMTAHFVCDSCDVGLSLIFADYEGHKILY